MTVEALEAEPNGVVIGTICEPPSSVAFSAPGRNSYDYRLVVSRKLYDRAVGTQMSRSLVNLAPGSAVHVHPLDLDSLGVSDGDDVKIGAPYVEGGKVTATVKAQAEVLAGKPGPALSGLETSLESFTQQNKPGALYAMLKPIAEHGISMTRIESRPSRQQIWEYVFYIDLDGHMGSGNVAAALAELSAETFAVKVLGSYPKAVL